MGGSSSKPTQQASNRIGINYTAINGTVSSNMDTAQIFISSVQQSLCNKYSGIFIEELKKQSLIPDTEPRKADQLINESMLDFKKSVEMVPGIDNNDKMILISSYEKFLTTAVKNITNKAGYADKGLAFKNLIDIVNSVCNTNTKAKFGAMSKPGRMSTPGGRPRDNKKKMLIIAAILGFLIYWFFIHNKPGSSFGKRRYR